MPKMKKNKKEIVMMEFCWNSRFQISQFFWKKKP